MAEETAFRETPRFVRWVADGASFIVVRTVLLRLLGGVYLVSFLSTFLQGRALIGTHGLLPMQRWLHAIAQHEGSRLAGFFAAPSVFWIDASDGALLALCVAGMALGFAVMLGVTNAAVMLVLWVLQLSLYDVGQVFWGYGWEMQLLETGMLAAVMCPVRTWRPFASAPPTASVWLMRWLVVRVMLGAGLIKLRGDPCWRELTCLMTHYETQPNPSPLSWVFHQLPAPVHTAGVLFNHLVEVVVPFFVVGPRSWRRAAGCLFVAFQVVLIASGNLAFLNWLTIVPAIACFDDAFLLRRVPARLHPPPLVPTRTHRRVALGYAAIVGILSFGPVLNLFSSHQQMNASFDPLHLVNTYGAFGTVSRVRDEVVLEGTRDPDPETAHWEEYELPCKPGDVRRRPCLVSPYHYRLDWQMWFAAMSSYEGEPWILDLADKLLHGDHAVDALLARNPFPDEPPRFVRARLYRYEMTTWSTRREGWWQRRLLGEYLRPLSLE